MKIQFSYNLHPKFAYWLLQIDHKLKKKMTMASESSDMTPSSIVFWCCFESFVKFSYWSVFHVNIITGSEVMTIFFYKGLTRNPNIGNTSIWVSPNIWRLRQVRNTQFGTNFSNKMVLNAVKSQGYNFYRFWVIKGKQITRSTLKVKKTATQ